MSVMMVLPPFLVEWENWRLSRAAPWEASLVDVCLGLSPRAMAASVSSQTKGGSESRLRREKVKSPSRKAKGAGRRTQTSKVSAYDRVRN